MRVITLFLFTLFFLPSISHARQILILHTNDLHSYFKGYHDGRGGYARLMTKIKELRASYEARGIEVLQVDAGDWGDGTSFYLADEGADSIRALELFGVEVAAVGNHDFMIGGKTLGDQIRRANVKTQFVAANLRPTSEMELDDVVLPYVDLIKGGVKLRIVGLTTDENFYEYAMRPGWIASPLTVGEREARKARRAGREVVMALTHIGLEQDKLLAKNSNSIDLIIGGHSHSKVKKVVWQENSWNQAIPIVQAFSHGLSVGSLLIEVSKSGVVRVKSYKLHDISSSLKRDPAMENFVEQVEVKRNKLFKIEWQEIIGETLTPISGSQNGDTSWRASCWGRHMAKATRGAVDADVGLHIPGFAGVYKRRGPVTFGDIIDSFPHLREFGDEGWEIATAWIPGWKLKPLMYLISRIGYGADFSGLGYKSLAALEDKAIYKVAFPAEIAVAIRGSLPQFNHLLRDLEFTGVYLWPVISQYVTQNSPIQC